MSMSGAGKQKSPDRGGNRDQGQRKKDNSIISQAWRNVKMQDLDALYERENELEEIVRALRAAERMHIDPEDAEFELEMCRAEIRAAMQAEEDAMYRAYERDVM